MQLSKAFLVIILCIPALRSLQQEHGQLPKIVPPSPEVSQLTKAGEVTSSLHTGAASVNIPLYDLSAGSIKHGIAINYATNGTKTTETPSRVGLNWNLIAGGMISRVIHDEADGESTYLTPPSGFPSQNQALLDYLFWAGQDGYDTEFDEYSISVNGVSGKFFMDATGVPRLTSHSNLLIQKTSYGFVVTTADGTKYFFGENEVVEKTTQLQLDGGNKFKTNTTAWFLTKVVSVEGHQMNFYYEPISTEGYFGPSQYVVLQPATNPSLGSCGACGGKYSPVTYNTVSYTTYYLESISTSNGQHVSFTYSARPTGDVTNDNRLASVSVYTTNGVETPQQLRKYQFEYEDFPAMTGPVRKYLLKKLKNNSVDVPSSETLVHTFEYYLDYALPEHNTLGQDYFGYANGVTTNLMFFPRPPDYVNWQHGSEGADREPRLAYTRNGSLKKVIYPTGGYEEFEYESHTILKDISNTTYSTETLIGGGYNTTTGNVITEYFTITNQFTSILYHTYAGSGTTTIFNPFSRLKIFRVSDNAQVYATSANTYAEQTLSPSLQVGVPYRIELSVWGDAHAATAVVKYDPVTTVTPTNIVGCGMRVKQINAYEPASNVTNSRYFKYAKIADLSKSSGVGVLATHHSGGHRSGGWCFVSVGGIQSETLNECFSNIEISSSALYNGYLFSGSPVAYETVTETNHPTLDNGGTEHYFHTVYNSTIAEPVLHDQVLNAPGNISADLNGMEKRTVHYKKQGNAFITLKDVVNEYVLDNRVYITRANYITRMRWAPSSNTSQPVSDRLKGYDIGEYSLSSGWIVLSQTTETDYDENGLHPVVKVTNYSYNNTQHTQPTLIEWTNSKQDAMSMVKKYPADYNSEPYLTMVNKHVITPLIESSKLKGTSALLTEKTDFSDWFADAKVLKPQLLTSTKAGAAAEGLLRFHSYYSDGNVRELSRENGMRIAYLWNYQQTFAVAEVKNASADDVAYTSFEGEDKGGWIFNEVNKIATGFTGDYSFSGTVTRAVSGSKSFVVTVWAKNNSPSLNNNAGTLVTTKNGWSLYKWTVSAATSVSITGTQIDELRIYPAGAQMTTYTYRPFIGISSVVDANDKATHYEYDVFYRLLRIRDMDGNIIKQFDYKYNQTY